MTAVEPCVGLLASADAVSAVEPGHGVAVPANLAPAPGSWHRTGTSAGPEQGRIDPVQGCDQARRSESGRRPRDRSTSGQQFGESHRKIFPAAAYVSRATENGTCDRFLAPTWHLCQEVGTAGRPEDVGAGAVNVCDQA